MESLSGLVGVAFALVLCTSFVKMFVALSILRAGLGGGLGLGVAVFALSLALTLVVVQPQFKAFGGIDGLIRGSAAASPGAFQTELRPFLARHADAEVTVRLQTLTVGKQSGGENNSKTNDVQEKAGKEAPDEVLIAAFLVSELRDAFVVGLIFILPFVVIDILVVNVLAALGITSFTPLMVALPLKLLLFIAVDGWVLLSERLLGGYL